MRSEAFQRPGSTANRAAISARGGWEAVADDARAREVALRHSSCEADEQSGAIRCGVGGAKGGDQGECGPAAHAPDSAPHKRVTDAGSHTAAHSCRGYPRREPYAGKLHVRYATVDGLHSLGRCPFFPFSDRNGRHRSRLIVSASRNGAAASHSAFRIAFGNSMARLMPRSVRTSTISY